MKSKRYQLNREDLKKWGKNAIIFSAPALVVFFTQLHNGVQWKEAGLVALLVFYGLMADLFKKWSDGK